MSVAAGPACELSELLDSPDSVRRYDFTLLDQDNEAIDEAKAEVARLSDVHGEQVRAEFVRASVRTMLRSKDLVANWGRVDFLYSMGLFDYLTRPVAEAVLRRLYELLAPGGQLVIGNFHVDNPTRTYMEFWMDWVLFYRTEDEFLGLADSLEGAEASVIFEETHSQMFLRVRKPS